MIREQIERKLKAIFKPIFIEVTDESYYHNSFLVDFKKHFKVLLVSEYFINESLLKRHRMVYNTLENEMHRIIHALKLHTYTIKEWEDSQDRGLDSPLCQWRNNDI